jgi:hypothetical protein
VCASNQLVNEVTASAETTLLRRHPFVGLRPFRNTRLARLRQLLSADHVNMGIDLADRKQAAAVADLRMLARG